MAKVIIRKKVNDTGWPCHTKSGKISRKYEKAHSKANRSALSTFGSKKANAISTLVKQTPAGELLGKHTRSGKIIISSKVPKSLRAAIIHHEKVEHQIMTEKR